MGTVHRLHVTDDRPPPRASRAGDSWGELELPGWEEFTTARDRFFENLRSAAEIYRSGEGHAANRAGRAEGPT